MASNSLYKVFVYGTLKRGEPNHHWFSKSADGYQKFLYRGRTKEKFPLIIATRYNIPFMLHAPGKGNEVRGEIYEVDEKVLRDLDCLEDHPNFYVRDQYDVESLDTPGQRSEKVWIYMVKSFKQELLDRTCYEEYSNDGGHGLKYLARYLRGESYDHKTDILLFSEDGNKK